MAQADCAITNKTRNVYYMRKSFRILLTENCNAHCPNCFNSKIRTNAEIPLPDIDKVCKILSKLGVNKIKIMGGEPTMHSDFTECIQRFQTYFDQLIIFTNAINQKITTIKPREEDIIDYNFNFISIKTIPGKYLLNEPGHRAFEIQITPHTDVYFIEKKLSHLIKLFDGRLIHIFLTCDCTSNIFANRTEIIAKFRSIIHYIDEQPLLIWHLDHMLPKCFVPDDLRCLPQLTSKKCTTECAGLIDASLNVVFCNQYHDYICSLDELSNMSDSQLDELFLYALDKKNNLLPLECHNCTSFNVDCNGGCFMHNQSRFI